VSVDIYLPSNILGSTTSNNLKFLAYLVQATAPVYLYHLKPNQWGSSVQSKTAVFAVFRKLLENREGPLSNFLMCYRHFSEICCPHLRSKKCRFMVILRLKDKTNLPKLSTKQEVTATTQTIYILSLALALVVVM